MTIRPSFLVFFAAAALCLAQSERGNITGVVTDASNGAVPNAPVKLVNVGTNAATEVMASSSGEYSVANLGPGTYKVIVTDANGCQSASANYILGGVGVSTVNANTEIKIYPNPAQTMIHIESDLSLHATIYSMDCRSLIDQADAKDINITSLADGVYVIKLTDENGVIMKTEKLVKAN